MLQGGMNMSDINTNIKSGCFTSIDATGVLKSNGSVYSNGGNVKGDGGFFEITILKNEIHVYGKNLCQIDPIQFAR